MNITLPIDRLIRTYTYTYTDTGVLDNLVDMIESRLLADSSDVYGLDYNVQAQLTAQLDDLDHNDPRWASFFDFMRASLGSWVLAQLGGLTPFQYTYQALWGVKYSRGAWARPHRHGATCVSFAFYPRAPAGLAPLKFDDFDYSVDTATGVLVLFPGWMSHSVDTYLPKEDLHRYVIAGNITTV